MSSGRRVTVFLLLVVVLAGGYLGRSQVESVAEAAAGVVSDWSTRLRDLGAAEPQTEVGLRSREGESASVLITIGSGSGDSAFTLVTSNPDGPPALVVLPQDLLAAVPGFGEFRLVDALGFGGPELVGLAITNEFGIRVDRVAALPAGAVAAGLPGRVEVELSAAMYVEDSEGSVSRVLSAGPADVTAEMVETLLVNPGAGDEFEWMQRQGSAWRSILDVVRDSPGAADRITTPGGAGAADAADLLVTVAGDSESLLATVPVARAVSSTGADALTPAGDDATRFFTERFGHLLLRPEGRPRIEILNGNGRIGTTADIAEILVPAGFRVIRTDNADNFDYEETLIVAQGDHAEEWAREIVELVGRGLLFLEVRAPSGVVDVSIIVGHDIPSGEG